MTVAVLAPVLLATSFAIEKIRDDARESALRGLRETVRATALTVDRDVHGSLSALKVLGNSETLNDRDFEKFYKQAAALNQLPDVWTLLFDQTGAQVVNSLLPYGTPAPSPSELGRVTQVIASQKPVVTEVFVGPTSRKMLTTLYAPAAAAGGQSFVVAQAVSLDYWKKAALHGALPPSWIVAVIDRNGNFISRSHKSEQYLGKQARPELVSAALASPEGLIRHLTLEGIESYDAFMHSSLTGWTIAVAAPVALVEQAAANAVYLSLLGIGAALLVAIGAVVLFGRRFITAINSAHSAAAALGRGESPQPTNTPVSELGELNCALVNAGALLQTERSSRLAAEAERERLLQNETLARETAQAENHAKDQFLAMLGHELRNPLAAISGAAALLETAGPDKDRAHRYLDIINRQNKHLTHIVNDLLDVSRLMAGKIMLERCPLNLADCVVSCVDALRITDRAQGYVIDIHSTPVWVNADWARIEQIVNNLITNALKFSPAASKIEVLVAANAGTAVVTVRDPGAGMPSDLLQRVFEPFFQGPAPVNRLQSGMGIGLALVRQLVTLHGGKVQASSSGLGQGSTFSFSLPAIAVPPAQQTAQTAQAVQTVQTDKRKQAAPLPVIRKIVYVEDNADARGTLAELLRMFDYQVTEVTDGASTLPAVRAVKPDLVLMDIGLPDMDGYAVARGLRADPFTCTVPLIALTGYGQIRDKEAAALSGFDAHLVKPVDPDELVATIEGVLGRWAAAPSG
ncbi:ATP-binding protein [Polaromonas sp.]|uniref:hybrid sensor histidine kinase/response regulator n=1 Tax=Polaromonas sp. TaxID=1869339 RepID=UPI0035671D6D